MSLSSSQSNFAFTQRHRQKDSTNAFQITKEQWEVRRQRELIWKRERTCPSRPSSRCFPLFFPINLSVHPTTQTEGFHTRIPQNKDEKVRRQHGNANSHAPSTILPLLVRQIAHHLDADGLGKAVHALRDVM